MAVKVAIEPKSVKVTLNDYYFNISHEDARQLRASLNVMLGAQDEREQFNETIKRESKGA